MGTDLLLTHKELYKWENSAMSNMYEQDSGGFMIENYQNYTFLDFRAQCNLSVTVQ